MISVTEAFELVRSSVKPSSERVKRLSPAASHGDVIRQGDVYIEVLDRLPAKCVKTKTELQLAPGTTRGSRHVLSSAEGIEMFKPADNSPLVGPVFCAKQEVTVTHPDHPHWVLPPGYYAVTYQRALAEEMRRLLD